MLQSIGLVKTYSLGERTGQGYTTFREAIMRGFGRPFHRLVATATGSRSNGGAQSSSSSTIHALNDVSFSISPGEAVGVIGHNGAGKSTLLKILSRITQPTSGRVMISGRVGSLLEVGTGFHPELTGRENIFLNGAILGMPRREVVRNLDKIIDFAEIEEFLDTPVKRYSSGMYVRLGFAVAAHMCPDILLIDEVLAVGDLKFQRKCMEHSKELLKRSATVIIVSHNMFAIRALCQRGIYLSKGRLIHDGPVDQAIQLYEEDSRYRTPAWAEDQIVTDQGRRLIEIESIETFGEDGKSRSVFEHGERMRVRIRSRVSRPLTRPNLIVAVIRSDNLTCCNYNTFMDGFALPCLDSDREIELTTPTLKLIAGSYTIQVLVRDEKFQRLFCAQIGPSFQVSSDLLSTHFGVFHEKADWSIVS